MLDYCRCRLQRECDSRVQPLAPSGKARTEVHSGALAFHAYAAGIAPAGIILPAPDSACCAPLRPIAVSGRPEALCLSTSAVQRAAAPPSFTASAPLARSDLDPNGQGLLSTAAFEQETAGAPVIDTHDDRGFQIGAAAHSHFSNPSHGGPRLIAAVDSVELLSIQTDGHETSPTLAGLANAMPRSSTQIKRKRARPLLSRTLANQLSPTQMAGLMG